MKVAKTKFNGLLVFKKKYFTDTRGYFLELYKSKIIRKRFPFTCISLSKKNVGFLNKAASIPEVPALNTE